VALDDLAIEVFGVRQIRSAKQPAVQSLQIVSGWNSGLSYSFLINP